MIKVEFMVYHKYNELLFSKNLFYSDMIFYN